LPDQAKLHKAEEEYHDTYHSLRIKTNYNKIEYRINFNGWETFLQIHLL